MLFGGACVIRILLDFSQGLFVEFEKEKSSDDNTPVKTRGLLNDILESEVVKKRERKDTSFRIFSTDNKGN